MWLCLLDTQPAQGERRMSKPIAKVWIGERSYFIYKLPIRGENVDKIELYRKLTKNEKLCLIPMIIDAEIKKEYEENEE